MSLLLADGYDGTLDVSADGIRTRSDPTTRSGDCRHPTNETIKERVFRFEGASNPEDSSIVLGIRCQRCGDTGIVVSAYGHASDPRLFAILNQMATSRTAHDPVR